MKVLVTGHRRGIGKVTASLLESRGHTLVRFAGDVRSPSAWEAYVGQGITGLANIAAIPSTASVTDEGLAVFQNVLDVNVIGPWLGMKHLIPGMVQAGGGSVVNVTSVYADDGGIGLAAAYHASKGALSILTRNAARKYARAGVRVNEIRAGFTETDLTSAYFSNPKYKEFVDSRCPMKRLGSPTEIADAIEFLLSERASFITGASLAVDGGWLA